MSAAGLVGFADDGRCCTTKVVLTGALAAALATLGLPSLGEGSDPLAMLPLAAAGFCLASIPAESMKQDDPDRTRIPRDNGVVVAFSRMLSCVASSK